MNTNKAFRELRAWAVKYGITIEIHNLRPHVKKEAHIQTGTAFSSKPVREMDFGHRIRSRFDSKKEMDRVDRIRSRKLKPLFK